LVSLTPIKPASRAEPASPLGPEEGWPPLLRTAADLCRAAALPTTLCWGPERTLLQNEAWRSAVGEADVPLGPGSRLWPVLAPLVEEVERSGEGAFVREQPLPLERESGEEETYWNCHALPIRDEGGRLAGVLLQANDVTKTVMVERRLSFQIQLADRLRGLSDPQEAKAAAIEMLGRYLDCSRVGYAEVDEERGIARVRRDWTRDEGVISLAGQSAALESFGPEAMAYLRAGQVMAIDDIRALAMGGDEVTKAWEAAGVRALITVPLVRGGGLKALLFAHEPTPRAWRRADAAIARDVAERTWAAVERAHAEQSLRESEDHYRHTVELNPQVTWTALPDGQLNRVSRRWREWTGTAGLGQSWAEGLHPDDRPPTFDAWARSVETGEPYDIEHRVKRIDGSYRWARSRAFPRRDEEGRIILWYGSTEDIHERKVAEEHQSLLINELNHRVKNTLASVQGIAFQTLKGDVPLADARARFEARLVALSRAHNLLTEQNWGGASLDRVVGDATEHLGGARRFDIAGEPLRLAPRAALAIAMALHELGTNAAKYGALSSESGRVAIGWETADGLLRLIWRETGGPGVGAPERRGFGSRLIEKGLAADLGGRAELRFEPEGVICRIEAPLDALRATEPTIG
jgi:PAS domain S-box-containing protein